MRLAFNESELAFQRAQRAKREATDALRDGDVATASDLYRGASKDVRLAQASAPADSAPELAAEASLLDELAERANYDAMSARKTARADYHMKSRRRGRQPRR